MNRLLQNLLWLGGIILFAVVGYQGMTWGKRSATENVFEYDLEALKGVDSKLISHSETLTIPVDSPGLTAIAVDKADNIYVSADKELIKFNNTGTKLKSTKLEHAVTALTVGPDNTIYAALKEYVAILDSEMNVKATWPELGGRAVITSLAVSQENVYIADVGNKVALGCDLKGNITGKFGLKNEEKRSPGLIIPSPYFDILLDNESSLWLINTGRHSFENYNSDGYLTRSWEKSDSTIEGFSGCCNPTHVAIMPNGNFVTSEKGLVRVKIYSPGGEFLSVVATPKQFTDDTKGLDLAVDSKGRILVLDPERNEVRIFTVKEKR